MPEDVSQETFSAVRERLDRIAEEVSRDDIALDDALALYEEAVGLGLRACDLSEADLAEHAQVETEDGADPSEAQAGSMESVPGSERVLD